MNLFEVVRATAVVVLGAIGTWLLLPQRIRWVRPAVAQLAGGLLVAIALVLLATSWAAPSTFLSGVFFYAFGLTALGAAVATITARNPVYSALWFAAVVLASSGLFLLAGAQFLAAGTVIVYAGAIIVTFLFVIMLAQREGKATYDRTARSPARATLTCFLLFWSVLYALVLVKSPINFVEKDSTKRDAMRLTRGVSLVGFNGLPADSAIAEVHRRALTATSALPDDTTPALGRHVAGLGGTLFTDHLVVSELAGTLLFVALIGALCMATPKPPIRPGANPPHPGPA